MRRFGRRSPAPPVSESGNDRTQPDSQPIGLFQLWPDPELSGSAGIEIDVDVVAVHGLGGHAYKTWTEGQKLWLRDFIPKDLPRARILTFGYNAGLAFTKSTSTIRDFAIQLLEILRQLRRRTANDSVKTIFVCHSLGGIIVKQALIVAHERSVTYGSVASSVKGMVFLGTPHRGSDIAYWSGLLTKVANIAVLGRLRQDLLDNLRPKSTELGTICSQFVERGIGLQIFSLYERLTMPVINALVVDEMSAILHLPNETAIPLEADHQTMCKFLASSNPNYIVVRDCIDEIIETLARVSGSSFFTPSQDMFMRRLRVINEVDMLQRVPSSWGKSHDWLINHQSFKSWTGYQGLRVLWMYGGPGSGKTVLSKTIVLYLNQISESDPDTGIIRKPVYFFFDDKDPKTQTNTAFVSSVLYQILEDTKTAFVIRYLDNTHLNISQPDEDTLWQCLLSIIERSRGIIFQFVVDAIDELYRIRETSSVTLLERLEGLLAADVSGHMRLLITDRKVPDEGFLRSAGPSLIDVETRAPVK